MTQEQAIQLCRDLNLKAADKLSEKGITTEDIMAGALQAIFDIATVLHKGDAVAAIDFLRDGIDGFERQLMEQGKETRQ